MTDRTVTIQIEGAPEDQGRVRLSEFTQQLDAVKGALRHTERLVSGSEQPVLYHRIVDVRRTSPLTVVIEAVPIEVPKATATTPDFSEPTITKFFAYMRQVKSKQVPPDIDLPALQAFRDVAVLLDKHISEIAILNSHERIAIDREFRATIDAYIGPDEIVEGSIAGVLEKVNLHNTHRFYVYPTVGPKQVECDFVPDLRKKVKEGLDSYVRVYGKLRYKWLSPFPYAVNATELDVYPPEEDLPTIFDLKGIAPDATSGLKAEDFIEKIRSADNW